MKAQDLIECGFKKKGDSGGFWYELKVRGGHLFITNDNYYNNGKDVWIIGYENPKDFNSIFWFNNKLKEEGVFKIVFHLLVGVDFKLAHQRKLILSSKEKPKAYPV